MGEVMEQDETLAGAAGLDDLHTEQLDHEEAKAAEKALLVPAGKYLTVPALNVTVFEDEDDKRKIAVLTGRGVEREKGNEESMRLKFSWQYRENERRAGKPDSAYKAYLQIKRAYKEANGQDAQTPAELIQYAANYPLEVRYRHFENDEGETVAFVAGIAAPRDI